MRGFQKTPSSDSSSTGSRPMSRQALSAPTAQAHSSTTPPPEFRIAALVPRRTRRPIDTSSTPLSSTTTSPSRPRSKALVTQIEQCSTSPRSSTSQTWARSLRPPSTSLRVTRPECRRTFLPRLAPRSQVGMVR